MSPPRLDRRALLGCAALCGAVPLLSACSSDRAGEGAADDPTTGGPSDEQGGGQGGALVPVSDVPLGGGVVLTDQRILVTQPSDTDFKAFEAVCTHQGGAITRIEDGEMICSLHQSRFSIADGEVLSGPASNPLPEIDVRVRDGQVVRA
jgi:nitrite reductase/ring-hydroxylating ferredoxin subunit